MVSPELDPAGCRRCGAARGPGRPGGGGGARSRGWGRAAARSAASAASASAICSKLGDDPLQPLDPLGRHRAEHRPRRVLVGRPGAELAPAPSPVEGPVAIRHPLAADLPQHLGRSLIEHLPRQEDGIERRVVDRLVAVLAQQPDEPVHVRRRPVPSAAPSGCGARPSGRAASGSPRAVSSSPATNTAGSSSQGGEGEESCPGR